MQDPQESEYFEHRAEEERTAADRATDERAAKSHRELAKRYERQAEANAGGRDEDEASNPGTLSKDFKIIP